MEAVKLQEIQNKYEKDYHKPIHDSVMRSLRTADQFIHTGLERADEAHQEAHVLLEKWEKFALKLDQRRKLLSIVVSFYKQTEDASERLSQIEREIRLENEKIRTLNEEENSSSSSSEKKRSNSRSKKSATNKMSNTVNNNSNVTTTTTTTATTIDDVTSSTPAKIVVERSQKNASPTNELAQRHVVLSNQLAEASASGLREARIVLEKISDDNYEAKHVIRKVYEFTEQVNDLKKKLVNNFFLIIEFKE